LYGGEDPVVRLDCTSPFVGKAVVEGAVRLGPVPKKLDQAQCVRMIVRVEDREVEATICLELCEYVAIGCRARTLSCRDGDPLQPVGVQRRERVARRAALEHCTECVALAEVRHVQLGDEIAPPRAVDDLSFLLEDTK